MHNYGQQGGYRPGSTSSFAGQPPPPPPPPSYGAPQGYQSAAPQAQSQWGAPAQTPTQTTNPWNQTQQQAAGGYQPSTYGAMPGGYAQQQQQHTQPSYAAQNDDKPPPPPPKPYGFAGAIQAQQQQQQQATQGWSQPQQHTQTQQGGYPVSGATQKPYNNAAPPPPSATPGGSYFPPTQAGRPASVYGGTPQQTTNITSPNEQQPAYIPPSLTGQGVQAYMPSNTNPAPGVYVPPPPDIPAWQQAQHAPLQGGTKKFTYTKPTVDPKFYAQGYQGVQPMAQQHATQQQPQGQYGQPAVQHQQPQQPYGQVQQSQPTQSQYLQQQHTQYGQPATSQTQAYGQTSQQQGQYPQQQMPPPPPPPPAYGQDGTGQQQQQQPQQPQNPQYNQPQWQQPAPANQGFNQQQHAETPPAAYQQPAQQTQWQPGHQHASSVAGQLYTNSQDQSMPAPKPLSRTDTAPSAFFNQTSPESQPVSPINSRQSVNYASNNQTGIGRAGSVSSIALANLHAQRVAENRTSSPKPAPPKMPTPPPPRDDKSKFSALASGGPSDWELFGGENEIDDEELYAKKTDKPVQLDSVELPAHVPSPPSTHDFPSPQTHPVPLHGDQRDTYAPTPPPAAASPAFVIPDMAPAPLRPSPKPSQGAQAPPPQQTFVMGDAQPQKAAQVQHQGQQPPSMQQQGFVMNDGGWAAQSNAPLGRQHTPVQQQVQTGFVMNDAGYGASQVTPTQAQAPWGAQANHNHAEELRLKDEAHETFKADSEKERADLRAEHDRQMTSLRSEFETERTTLRAQLEKLKVDAEESNARAATEAVALHEQIKGLNASTEETRSKHDATTKEKDMTIERLKEDVEGKEHNIEERDATIAELKSQLEAEKSKELPKPSAADLIPDLDPWYADSLERYISMLRGEAHEGEVENKIKTFKAFLKSESAIRGLEYNDEPPPPPQQAEPEKPSLSRSTSDGSTRKQALNVHVPQESHSEEEYDFSPGGRPIMRQKAQNAAFDGAPIQQHNISKNAQSTTVLTPTSSVDDDMKTPIQSPPEEQPQPQYKAYVPPSAAPSNEPVPIAHRPTMPFSNISNSSLPTPPAGPSRGHDEIFFSGPKPSTSKPTSRPTTSDSASADTPVPVPAPLSFSSARPTSVAPPAKKDLTKALADLLPSKDKAPQPSQAIEELRAQLTSMKQDSESPEDLTKAWEKTASLTRRKNDDARRKRQEENEEHNDDLFNNNEISYAEMNQLEDEFKQKEGLQKAREDKDEYENFVKAVFDKVYDGLQADIKSLMDIYIEAEGLLHTSVSGTKSLEANNAPSTKECLELLNDLHREIETKHEKVVKAVAERDSRYKKTEVQPLYAAGNIAKMKSVQRHFENAEKQAALRAKREKAERVGELVKMAEEVVVHAVGVEQNEIDQIIAAIKNLDDSGDNADLLGLAQSTLGSLKTSSKALLRLFNDMEIALNDTVLDAEIAEAKAGGADTAKIQELENEKGAGAKKMTGEYDRRVAVLDQDEAEIKELIARKGGSVEGGEELEKERRLKAALEEAKRRNGHA